MQLEKPDFKDYKNGTLKLGTIFHNQEMFKIFKLNIEDLKRHILIYGQTGTGKTTFLKNFLHNFEKLYPNIPFILFEFKGEYKELMKDVESIKVIKPGYNFFFNPFDNDIFPKHNYVEVLFDALRSCQIIEANSDFSPQMEKILIEALKVVCLNKNKQSWKFFFEILKKFSRTKKEDIPQISQTIISITNRLRRYYDGPLKSLFNFSESSKKISDLLTQNCIIDLGSILNLGGSKEDVIFFANLVLKWIWEYNMKKKPTDELEHLTIFEDASYIASKKMLETTKISTYLEDIAMLLRGKGEALITLTTTLDISKNIIRNSGSKFFFKFNEKNEDVIHFLGFQSIFPLKVNELTTGYCLAKIDSIPNAFLLKIENKKKNRIINEEKSIIIEENNNEENVSNVDLKKKNQISLQKINKEIEKLIKKAEILYKQEKYELCVKVVLHSYKELIKKYRIFLKIPEFINFENFYEKISIDFYWKGSILSKSTSFFLKIIKKYKKTKFISSFEAMNSVYILKSVFNNLQEFNSSFSENQNEIKVLEKENNRSEPKMKSKKHLGIFNVRLYYFHRIIGPENYYQIGFTSIDDEIENKIPKYMDVNMGEMKISIEKYNFYINIFEIDSDWARGNKELLEFVIFFDNKKESIKEIPNEIIILARNFINKLKNNRNGFKSFYEYSSEIFKQKKEEIIKESRSLKMDLNKFYQKINGIIYSDINMEKSEDKQNLPILTKIEEEIQKLLIREKCEMI
ncbi:MAG: ATP-binding protein [Promethearchaeota archaeon]